MNDTQAGKIKKSRRGARFAAMSFGAMGLLATVIPAKAQFSEWVQTGTGAWDNAANWSDGLPDGKVAYFANGGTAIAGAGVSSNFFYLDMGETVGGGGTLNITGGNLVGDSQSTSRLGSSAGSFGTVNVSAGSWTGTGGLMVGKAGTGVLNISGGLVQTGKTDVGYTAGGQGTVTVSGGTWNNANSIAIGGDTVGSLTLSGGKMTNGNNPVFSVVVGEFSGGKGTVQVTGGATWESTGEFIVGYSGTGTVTIDNGTVQNADGEIGFSSGNGSVIVTGETATWINTGNLTVGMGGDGNTLTLQDGGLATADGSLVYSSILFGSFTRLDGGYIALLGDQVSAVETLIANGRFQVWNGSAWVTSTNVNDFSFGYFATDVAAQDFSGREGLGNYTILSNNAIPEPSTWALGGLGAAIVAFRVMRRRRAV